MNVGMMFSLAGEGFVSTRLRGSATVILDVTRSDAEVEEFGIWGLQISDADTTFVVADFDIFPGSNAIDFKMPIATDGDAVSNINVVIKNYGGVLPRYHGHFS